MQSHTKLPSFALQAGCDWNWSAGTLRSHRAQDSGGVWREALAAQQESSELPRPRRPRGPGIHCALGKWVLCPNMSACAWAPQDWASPFLEEPGRGRQPGEDRNQPQARAECVGLVLQLGVCSDLRNRPQQLLLEVQPAAAQHQGASGQTQLTQF